MTPLLLALALNAAPPSEADRLFAEARELMKTRPAEACPKFERSFELDPALGTLLNFALCLEHTGRWASAWVRFNQAKEWAIRTHESDREKVAHDHAEAVAKKVSWIGLSTAVELPGLEVEVDRQRLRLTAPQSVPVDPGTHAVTANAPGHRSWSTTVDAPPTGGTVRLVVPTLEPLEKPAPPPPVAKVEPTPALPSASTDPVPVLVVNQPTTATPSRVPGVLVVTAGALLVAGGIVGLVYSLDVNQRAQAQRIDSPTSGSPSVTRGEFEVARTLFPASLAGIGVGALCSGLGIWLLAHKAEPVAVSLVLTSERSLITFSSMF